MPLSQSQKSLIEKARNVGGSDMAVPLDDAACSYLLARLAHDLNLAAPATSLARYWPQLPICAFYASLLPLMRAHDDAQCIAIWWWTNCRHAVGRPPQVRLQYPFTRMSITSSLLVTWRTPSRGCLAFGERG